MRLRRDGAELVSRIRRPCQSSGCHDNAVATSGASRSNRPLHCDRRHVWGTRLPAAARWHIPSLYAYTYSHSATSTTVLNVLFLLTLPASSCERLCNGTMSVCLSVPLIYSSSDVLRHCHNAGAGDMQSAATSGQRQCCDPTRIDAY